MTLTIMCGKAMLWHEQAGSTEVIPLTENRRETTVTLCVP